MTTHRSVLLTLALFALLLATAFVRNAVAAPRIAYAPEFAAGQPRYFVTVASQSSPQLGMQPSAAVNRQFAQQAATLRVQRGLASTDPVSSANIFPTHSANRSISLDQALAQAPRVAASRGLPSATVLALVAQYTEHFAFGGDAQVNLRMLNVALDELE